ncbi:MAG: hypothetical protein E7280_01380 [Lachnospiraceae bacterium]|nr:hypothetical protein [Lachnospiraceae bacterium]
MKQEKLYLYTLDMKYVRDLHKIDDRVQSVSPQIHKSIRPFVGIVVVCEEHLYCVPVDHAVIKKMNVRIEPHDNGAEKAYKILCAKELDWVLKKRG